MGPIRTLSLVFLCGFLLACEPAGEQPRTLRIGNAAEPATLDPHTAHGVPARNIQRDLFEGLLRETADGGYEPGVAERWTVSPNGLKYTFHLRDDARWSNGDPVTAGDFVFSFRRAASPGTGGVVAETLFPISNARAVLRGEQPPEALGVSASGPRELVIELHRPAGYFLHLLTHPSTFPVHAESLREHSDWTRPGKLVSNGAYQLVDWRVQSAITLEKNPHYWDVDNVAIERVQFLPVEDLNAELSRFAAGELDITYGVPIGRLNRLRQEYADELRVAPWFGTYYLGINTTRPPLDDVRLRKALTLAIDRDVLARDVVGGGETAAYHWVPPLPDYRSPAPEWATWSQARRETEARKLVAELDSAVPARIQLLYNTRDRDQRVVTAVAAMWRRVLGIETELRNEEWKVYLQSRRQLDRTETFRSGWIGDYPDPYAFAELLHSTHGMNEFGWNNPRYDALLTEAASAGSESRRHELLRQAEEILLAELPLIPLFHYSKARLVSDEVGGYASNPLDHHYSRNYFWKE
ncbi:MAG: peptide ABC transporter substrate-binding protein [Gammaproteobacteria bacterium]|nr:peptide ABC transporter substrate-binding protein [Gammaproteobacteria bacterium]